VTAKDGVGASGMQELAMLAEIQKYCKVFLMCINYDDYF
jgi:hypothetical protein